MEKEIINLIDKYNLPKFKSVTCVWCNRDGLKIPSAIIGAEECGMSTTEYIKHDQSYSEDINGYVCDACYRKVGEPKVKIFRNATKIDLIKSKLDLLHICVVNN